MWGSVYKGMKCLFAQMPVIQTPAGPELANLNQKQPCSVHFISLYSQQIFWFFSFHQKEIGRRMVWRENKWFLELFFNFSKILWIKWNKFKAGLFIWVLLSESIWYVGLNKAGFLWGLPVNCNIFSRIPLPTSRQQPVSLHRDDQNCFLTLPTVPWGDAPSLKERSLV